MNKLNGVFWTVPCLQLMKWWLRPSYSSYVPLSCVISNTQRDTGDVYLEQLFSRELVHPSAHSSPQPIRQMDRFSRFCTAYGRKCLYFTMGAPIHQNCPFPWGIGTSHVAHDAFGPYKSTTQMATRSVQLSLHRWLQSVSILYNDLPVFPSKLPLPMLVSGPHYGRHME